MQVVSRKTFQDALSRADREIPRSPDDVQVAGVRYRLIERLAAGDRADLWLATRARNLTERTILKALRDRADAPSVQREWDALEALHASTAQGAPHFSLRLPPLVAKGDARFADGSVRPAILFRSLPGYDGTLEDVRQAFPAGVDPRHAAWMWRRLLELLGWIHRSGWAHGAVTPAQVLLHAREHGAILVGWSKATPLGKGASAESDLVMAARSVLGVLGDDTGEAPELRELLRACASGRLPSTDGWKLKDLVADAAERAFGPPTFVPFLFSPHRGKERS
jgi:hypothetical protein